jgi:hypothetical protein
MKKENEFFDCVMNLIESECSYREARERVRSRHSTKSLVATEMFEEERIGLSRFTDWMITYKNDFREAQTFLKEHFRKLKEEKKNETTFFWISSDEA